MKYPTVFVIHRGGFIAGTKGFGSTFPQQQLDEMLSRDWIVVSIDYRLAPDAFFVDVVQDVQDAYYWIREELINDYPIDPDQIIVMAKSAGGGLAAMCGYLLTPRPKVMLLFYPGCVDSIDKFSYDLSTPVDNSLVTMADAKRTLLTEYIPVGDADERNILFDTALLSGKTGWLLTTDDQNEPRDRILATLRLYSTVHHVDMHYPPTYLVHGISDNTVPYTQSVELSEALKANRVSYKLDLMADTDHGLICRMI